MARIERIREFLKSDLDNSALWVELIEALVVKGKLKEAFSVVNESSRYNVNDPLLISWTGHLGLALNDYKVAVTSYNELFHRGFNQAGLKINCAFANYQLGNFKVAKELFDGVEGLDVKNCILKARCNAQLEEVPSAITDVMSLLERCTREQLPEVLGFLSLLYLDDGQYQLAEEHCKKALALDDKQLDARIVVASLALYRVQIDDAMALIEPLDTAYPDTGRILAMKALVFMYRQQFEFAITAYERACEKMPNHVGSCINLGWCYFAVADLNKAEDCFRAGMAIDRTFAELHGGMALIYAFREKWPQSQKNFKRALKLDPFSPSALFAQALHFKTKEKSAEAEKIVSGLMEHKSELSDMNLKEIVSSFFKRSRKQ